MSREMTVTIKRIHHVHTSTNGGYVRYWKLIVEAFSKAPTVTPLLSRSKKFYLYFSLIMCTIFWWGTLKPLGQFFKKKVTTKGEIELYGHQLSWDLDQTVVLYFLGIPFWCYSSTPTLEFMKERMAS